MTDVLVWAGLITAGLIAGWVNTLAGAGGVVAIPALMLCGLPADVANASFRVAVVAQCATGSYGYHRAGKLPTKGLVAIAIPTVAGALAGAQVATVLPNAIFAPLALGTMALMAVALLWRADALAPGPDETPRRPGLVGGLALVGAGFYGGLLQGGVGFVLLAVIAGLLRHNLVVANGYKVVVTLIFNVATLVLFLVAGKVSWPPALIMAIGNMVGAGLAVRFAISRGQDAIKKVVVVCVIGACVALLVR
jgi:uncharacterized membrane protein YfcA